MPRIRHDQQYLPTVWTALDAISQGQEATFVEIVLCNQTTTARKVGVALVPSGGTVPTGALASGNANSRRYFTVFLQNQNALQPGETRVYSLTPFMGPGDQIFWCTEVANTVTGGIAINEESAPIN